MNLKRLFTAIHYCCLEGTYSKGDISNFIINTSALVAEELLGKLDAEIPVDWDDDEAILSTVELQMGKMFSPSFGSYVEALVGIGDDRPYDWGAGVGVRFNY